MMIKKEINLISDTITRPTPEMLDFMMKAEVGDDVFYSDPTVIALQNKISSLFGMEAALFFPSGTMANQTAIKLHTQPAEQLICDKWSHVYNYESGGASFHSGVSCKLIDGHRGMFKAEQLSEVINDPEQYYLPLSSLVVVENTTNKGGGACWDYTELEKIQKVCAERGLSYHLDGARLFNALVAKNEEPKQYGKLFDSISICLSKGLGAPIGSLLLSSEENIHKAIRLRKLFGGGMRQVGYLAAAGIYALDHNVDRLQEDHDRAKSLGKALKASDWVEKVEPVETNIIIFKLHQHLDEKLFLTALEKEQIKIISMGEGKLRIVTHLEFTDEMLSKVIEVLERI
ncbi:threonine aldolase family protein [Lutimonas sp.]|uniref:threonine aldolase family protein n=1 Tax=Lutimonas sp. TaxID=1872403 RepID=UPI003C78CF52